jgi:hypothetical protein
MASWIVHLRIAEDLLERIEGLDAPLFAIGNIAPDSGIPDEKWEKFDPPPEVTHFQNPTNHRRDCEDLRFYREYLAGIDHRDAPGYSFRLGYFFHLITDNLWSLKIGRPTQAKFKTQFEADKSFIWTVKKDWYGLDFQHVRANPVSLFWRVFVPAEYDRADLPFLPDGAVKRQLQYIKDYYRRDDAEITELINHPYVYLTQAQMDHFVREAADCLYNICIALRRGLPAGDIYTALDLPL